MRVWACILISAVCVFAACVDDHSCSLGGTCVRGVCECDSTWKGENCSELNLLPARTGLALSRPTSSSWGGSVLEIGGKYHMFVANFINHCGLSSWQRNSEIAYATSSSLEGFTLVTPDNKPIDTVFSHNPTVHGPTSDGYYVLYHVGNGNGSSHGPPLECNGTEERSMPERNVLPETRADPPSTIGVETMYSKSIDGPWTSLAVPGTKCANPAGLILKNGTVLMACKLGLNAAANVQMVMYTAPSWRGPFTFRSITPVFGEDPYIWQDPRGRFHMLLHSMLPTKVHTTAWSADGLNWTPNGFAGPPNPQPRMSMPKRIDLVGGGSTSFTRRERHQLLFNDQGWPIALYNGVTIGPTDPHYADRSYTAVQPIKA